MSQQNHIINRQVIEVHLPKTANAQQVQQSLSKMFNEELLPVINTLLDKHFGEHMEAHHQIDQLIVDLGQLELKDLTKRFGEELDGSLAEIKQTHLEQDAFEQKTPDPQKTPLQVVSHYLATGRLPWWCSNHSKAYLLEQLDVLIEKPLPTFKALVSQLRLNSVHLSRFVNTFSADQMLLSVDLVSGTAVTTIRAFVTEIEGFIQKHQVQKTKEIAHRQVLNALISTMLHQLPTDQQSGQSFSELKGHYRLQVLKALGVTIQTATADQQNPAVASSQKKTTDQQNPAIAAVQTPPAGKQNPAIAAIHTLAKKHRANHRENAIWQQVFLQISKILAHPSIHILPDHLLVHLEHLLIDLQKATKDTLLEVDHPISTESDPVKFQKQLESLSRSMVLPLARHLHSVEKALQEVATRSTPTVIEKLQSQFDDTDFMTIDNAGLVILWPFLPRFFENLGLMTNKEFTDEETNHKAVCVLQHLCNEDQSALFEGTLSLPKILCEISLEDPIAITELSDEDIQVASGLLTSVIARGSHWTNLSVEGFRASYLCRQGSLKIRDNHWLLQVQKETFDITLEKLPWSFNTIKLPWMNKMIQVEWIQ